MDSQAEGGVFSMVVLEESDECGFGGAVGGHAWNLDVGEFGGDVDEDSLFAFGV